MNWHLEFGPIEDLRLQNHRLPSDLRSAHPKRKNHYLNGRLAMQRALQAFGYSTWVSTKTNGYPKMPEGFTGSIAHSERFVAAVVAREQDHRGVGVDCEEWIQPKVDQDIWPRILNPNEVRFKEHLSLLFSAKESIYKAYSGKLGFFDFNEVEITSIEENSFWYRFVNHRILGRGHFSTGEHHVLTIVATGPTWMC